MACLLSICTSTNPHPGYTFGNNRGCHLVIHNAALYKRVYGTILYHVTVLSCGLVCSRKFSNDHKFSKCAKYKLKKKHWTTTDIEWQIIWMMQKCFSCKIVYRQITPLCHIKTGSLHDCVDINSPNVKRYSDKCNKNKIKIVQWYFAHFLLYHFQERVVEKNLIFYSQKCGLDLFVHG